MILRRVRLEDRDWFCQLAAGKEFPVHPHTQISGQERARQLAQRYRDGWEQLLAQPEMLVLVSQEPDGYAVLLRQDRDSLTQDRQSILWDWAGELKPFLPVLLKQAAAAGDRYLVARSQPGQEEGFLNLGFLAESRRLLAPVLGKPNRSQFTVRPATPQDVFFIANLHSQGSQFYVPSHREVDREEMISRTMTIYLGLDFGPDSPVWGRIICWKDKPSGYVLYKLGMRVEETGESAAYLYDINLLPEFWGRLGARILLRQAMLDLAELGVKYVAADISCDNDNAFQLATRGIEFALEWTRFGLRTGR
ncbi:GNAT family N-acetyltransferase [bacterium]|nr:GNAT family N-acetyltransferase [bacterium]